MSSDVGRSTGAHAELAETIHRLREWGDWQHCTRAPSLGIPLDPILKLYLSGYREVRNRRAYGHNEALAIQTDQIVAAMPERHGVLLVLSYVCALPSRRAAHVASRVPVDWSGDGRRTKMDIAYRTYQRRLSTAESVFDSLLTK